MTEPISPQQQLKKFINAAQHLTALTSGRDIRQETCNTLIRYFGADVAAFGERRSDGAIEIGPRVSSDRWSDAWLPEVVMTAGMGDVFDSGSLTLLSSAAAEPVAAGVFPILNANRVIAVMLVGHLSADPLAKESIDLYLAVAGLIGATYSRVIAEKDVLKAKEELERRIAELAAEPGAKNEDPAGLELSRQETKLAEEALGENEERRLKLVSILTPEGDIGNMDLAHIIDARGTNTAIFEQVERDMGTLQDSEERFRHLVDAIRDYAIFMLDVNGRVTSWNEGAKRLKGWDEQEILGRHFSIFYTEEAVAARHPEKELEIAAAEGRYEEEGWRVRKDGSRFIANVIITAIRDESGRLRGFSKITRDITERKQAEERLQATLMDLERSNKELEQFAYVASHDLQEPLRMVASYTQLLAQRYEGQLDEKARRYINYAVDGAIRMQRLINDLLAFSRINTQGKTIKEISSHTVLGEAIHNLAAAIEENRALITSDDLPTVRADATQLSLLFQNLIGNAIKYRSADLPSIHVSACDLGREWRFSVKDNGIGIDAKYAEKVFVLFQRLHSEQEYPGTGIGLAMCKRIVERHGGRIWFESALGNGSTFYFTLPK